MSREVSLEFYKKTLLLPGISKSIFLSFFVGIVSTLLSLFLSQVILSKLYYTKYLASLKKILFPLIAFPHLTMAIGISFLFSSSGYLIRLISLIYDFERPPNTNLFPDDFGLFLILGLILKEVPFFLLISLGVISTIRIKEYFFLGKTQDYSDLSSWLLFVFPLIYKKIKITIFVVLIFSSTVIDMSLVLAPTTPSTLSIRILQQFAQPELSSYSLATCLSIFQFFLIFITIAIWLLIEKIIQNTNLFRIYKYVMVRIKNNFENTFFIFSCLLLVLFFMNILISFFWAFADIWKFPNLMPDKISFKNFYYFFYYNFNIFINTISLAFFGSILSLTFAIIWLEVTGYLKYDRKFLNSIFYIPLILPELSILLGINFFIIKLNFTNEYINLIWINMIYILPYTFLIFSNPYKKIDKNFIKIAKSFGHNYFTIIIKIKFGLILNLLFLTFAIGFIVSVSLYTPIYLVGNGEISTLSLEMVNFQNSADRRNLAVATILQMLIPLTVLMIFHLISKTFVKWKY